MIGEPSTNITKIVNEVYKVIKMLLRKTFVGKNWFMEIGRATMDQLMYEWTMNLMWEQVGTASIQFDTIQTSPGLYWQHRNYGTVVKYNFSTMSLDFLRARIEKNILNIVLISMLKEFIFKVGAGLYEFLQRNQKRIYSCWFSGSSW